MLFPVIVHKDENSEFGIIIPDFPGVYSGGESLEEALQNVQEAVMTCHCGNGSFCCPVPSSIESVLSCEDSKDGEVIMVDLDMSRIR